MHRKRGYSEVSGWEKGDREEVAERRDCSERNWFRQEVASGMCDSKRSRLREAIAWRRRCPEARFV